VITAAEGKQKGQEEKVERRGLAAAGLLVAAMTLPMAPIARAATVFDDFDGQAGASPDSDKWAVVEGTGWDSGVDDYSSDNAVLDGKDNLAIQARKTLFNKPFYVILNPAVGAGWAGLPDGKTEFPATMLVDWVNWEPP
jgi:hypothetical protein